MRAASTAHNLTVGVVKVPGGDGLANIGYVNSTGHDLGNVKIVGDLGRVNAGDGDPAAPATKRLIVQSMGQYGLDTQAGGG